MDVLGIDVFDHGLIVVASEFLKYCVYITLCTDKFEVIFRVAWKIIYDVFLFTLENILVKEMTFCVIAIVAINIDFQGIEMSMKQNF